MKFDAQIPNFQMYKIPQLTNQDCSRAVVQHVLLKWHWCDLTIKIIPFGQSFCIKQLSFIYMLKKNYFQNMVCKWYGKQWSVCYVKSRIEYGKCTIAEANDLKKKNELCRC